eukprot:CAMPEP_0119333648 /NCGR_PEP_ID=MMETSP1333-20130426/85662_1 /TAXON_ID=418940 /ORGANISM="Scyphosphaera apsteinii, Strain RCC1455" /LENGTH=128 /DNA_ID=CAMNT_0007343775 /DNA_START=164 /DNA_END=550 /DNA_ORIENTATION=+
MPSDGRVPLGLGSLQSISLRRVASFDKEMNRNQAVRAIPTEERRQAVIGLHRVESIDTIERELQTLQRQRHENTMDSLLSHEEDGLCLESMSPHMLFEEFANIHASGNVATDMLSESTTPCLSNLWCS